MDASIQAALGRGGIADITTTGRKSGKPHRIEIGFLTFDGGHFITGRPGRPRDWMANLRANPAFTLHLKRGVTADLAATATIIDDAETRAAVLRRIMEIWDNPPEKIDHILPRWVEGAPLISFDVAE